MYFFFIICEIHTSLAHTHERNPEKATHTHKENVAAPFQYYILKNLFSFWNYRIFSVCCSVFPRRTLSQPQRCCRCCCCCLFLFDLFTHRHIIWWSLLVHLLVCEHKRYALYGVTAFSFDISCCVFSVFKFDYHNFFFCARLYIFI